MDSYYFGAGVKLLFLILATFFISIKSDALIWETKIIDGVQWVDSYGEILAHDTEELIALPLKKDLPTVFSFSSPGGDLIETYKVSDVLLKLKKEFENNNQPVWSFSELTCSSACITLFVKFENRAMSAESKMGFHSPSLRGEPNEDLRKNYLLDLVNGGVNFFWIKDNIGMFLKSEIKLYSAQKLITEGSGLIKDSSQIISKDKLIKKLK